MSRGVLWRKLADAPDIWAKGIVLTAILQESSPTGASGLVHDLSVINGCRSSQQIQSCLDHIFLQ